ncbi:hypothetical protein PF010_g1300 [Phytophthora fragariae]|uniref:Uncharacterized protein n=1 Tax=Phytophthora fragariae TaxID=53985 RepID=A0A6G0M0F5_9STRA|nr:hypothetical protein PF010_g1300 [Phytophthora fragariae]
MPMVEHVAMFRVEQADADLFAACANVPHRRRSSNSVNAQHNTSPDYRDHWHSPINCMGHVICSSARSLAKCGAAVHVPYTSSRRPSSS